MKLFKLKGIIKLLRSDLQIGYTEQGRRVAYIKYKLVAMQVVHQFHGILLTEVLNFKGD